jgi:hypothetical protein
MTDFRKIIFAFWKAHPSFSIERQEKSRTEVKARDPFGNYFKNSVRDEGGWN